MYLHHHPSWDTDVFSSAPLNDLEWDEPPLSEAEWEAIADEADEAARWAAFDDEERARADA
jgi:hypothetical protein